MEQPKIDNPSTHFVGLLQTLDSTAVSARPRHRVQPRIPHGRLRSAMSRPKIRRNGLHQPPGLRLFEENDCMDALKALGEDTRVRIVSLLFEEPLGVCEVARRLGLTHYNVSKHLRILREAGLLDVETRGREHLYGVPE